jgi:SAM-dependent methyltransferase
VVGIEPSAGFLATASARLGDRVQLHQAAAAAIPLADAAVDVTVSALVLNFVPDTQAALREMVRVTAAGGSVAAYVWDYAGRMDLMRLFWDAAVALDPAAKALDEGQRFPLCRAETLADHFTRAGLAQVEVSAIEITTRFADFDDYWQPFLGGQGPAPTYAMALDEAARSRLRERIRSRIHFDADGAASLRARAWAVRGRVAP